jgi:disulfide bond formation protein DsbB
MTPLVQSTTTFLSLGIVLINIISLVLLGLLIFRIAKIDQPVTTKLSRFIANHALVLSFLVAFSAMVGSLFYSHVAGFDPCELCWLQRMFLFPQVLIFAVAWYRSWMYKISNGEVLRYGLAMSIVGGAIALFHYYGSMFNTDILAACEAGGVSCAKQYFLSFGYINIPFMALSTFILLGLIALIKILDR